MPDTRASFPENSGTIMLVLIGWDLAVPSLYLVPYGRHRSAPRMMAALAGVIQDRKCAENQKRNRG